MFCTVEILFPGLGDGWFSEAYRPENWGEDERWTYLFTELVPLVAFTVIAVVFWAIGRREQAASQRELAALDGSQREWKAPVLMLARRHIRLIVPAAGD